MAQKQDQQANNGDEMTQDQRIRERTEEIFNQLEQLGQLSQPNPDPIKGKAELEQIKQMGKGKQ